MTAVASTKWTGGMFQQQDIGSGFSGSEGSTKGSVSASDHQNIVDLFKIDHNGIFSSIYPLLIGAKTPTI
jgi:hypothetical protein